jgi:hypothetical protein
LDGASALGIEAISFLRNEKKIKPKARPLRKAQGRPRGNAQRKLCDFATLQLSKLYFPKKVAGMDKYFIFAAHKFK